MNQLCVLREAARSLQTYKLRALGRVASRALDLGGMVVSRQDHSVQTSVHSAGGPNARAVNVGRLFFFVRVHISSRDGPSAPCGRSPGQSVCAPHTGEACFSARSSRTCESRLPFQRIHLCRSSLAGKGSIPSSISLPIPAPSVAPLPAAEVHVARIHCCLPDHLRLRKLTFCPPPTYGN